MNTQQRAAVQQALEMANAALHEALDYIAKLKEENTALRQLLEQPERADELDLQMAQARDAAFEGWEKGEPMYWRDIGPSEIWEAAWKAAMKSADLRRVFLARPLLATPAQPEQADEPVADYGSEKPAHDIVGMDVTDGDKRLMRLLSDSLGSDRPAFDDLMALVMVARSTRPQPAAAPQPKGGAA